MTIKFSTTDFKDLVREIKGKDEIVFKAMKNTIDRSGTFTVNLSVKEIVKTVNLTSSYVKDHLRYVKRPSNSDLTAIIQASENSTLLSRFPNSVRSGRNGGGSVSVNKGSRVNISGLRYVTLNGGERAIGLFNKDALVAFRAALNKGEGATRLKVKKLQRINRLAKAKPYGRTPLFSRSVNQLFDTVKDDVQPPLRKFMQEGFLRDFKRLNK